LLYTHKQFCSRFVASVEYVPGLKQLLNDVFVMKQSSISLGFLHNFFQKKWSTCWIILLKIQPRLLDLWCSQNVVFFAIKTESWLLSKLFISSVSGEYRNFLREVWVFNFSVIVTLVDSRDGLVEPLLWSFVIAPLLSSFF
jgi:hypothetical protein